MLTAQVISQQNIWTEHQNIVTMCHIKNFFFNRQKSKISNIFERKDRIYIKISMIYIGDIYRANPATLTTLASKFKIKLLST